MRTSASELRPPESSLSDRERLLLEFERESWKLTIPKERAIRERFGFSSARYHQLLNRVVERPEAVVLVAEIDGSVVGYAYGTIEERGCVTW